MKQATKANNTGISGITPPSTPCNDPHCPYHGSIRLHGRTFVGNVLSSKAAKTATVAWERRYYFQKFERFGRRMTKLHVHNPPCINAVVGDKVKIIETRPLSKTKHFVIVEKVSAPHVRFVAHEFAGKKKEEQAAEQPGAAKKKKSARKQDTTESSNDEQSS